MERAEPKQPMEVPRLRLFARPSDNGVKEDSRSIKFELFFDLWFVANIQILAESTEISSPNDLKLYFAFLCVLWFTWFNVCMFDVRFMTDSIFERVIRIVQFASMAGFTVVVTKFDPRHETFDPTRSADSRLYANQVVLRLSLAAQYCSNFFIRYPERRSKTDQSRPATDSTPNGKPILAAVAVHFVAAMVYLGITFRFDHTHSSKVHLVWYIGSALEAIVQLGLASRFGVLTFEGTKLTERMAVFTVVVLGEGVSAITKTILLVVENGANWNPSIIGVFISGIATTYFIFLIYFDWMDHEHLSGYKQLVYSLFHFFLHAALLLFGAGTALFMKLAQAVKVLRQVQVEMRQQLMDAMAQITNWSESDLEAHNITTKSAALADTLWNVTLEIDARYPVKSATTVKTVTDVLDKVRLVPDGDWAASNHTSDNTLTNLTHIFYVEMSNSIATSFEVASLGTDDSDGVVLSKPQATADREAFIQSLGQHVGTTFRYMFVSSAIALLFMTFFHILTLPKRRRTAFDYIRIGLFFAAGLGLGLMPLISLNEEAEYAYYVSPWVLPTITLTVFFVFVLTHIHRPPGDLVSIPYRTESSTHPRVFVSDCI
ncbi:Low temperature requirement A [Apiospora aurea]|uniref:Low temperature requirement A n=1 Tax=Apiospora aurea TaxID=335848 RepID=A0ABR1QLZ4_9PEZI